MGRPKNSERTEVISFRIAQRDSQMVALAALKTGHSKSTFTRKAVRDMALKVINQNPVGKNESSQ